MVAGTREEEIRRFCSDRLAVVRGLTAGAPGVAIRVEEDETAIVVVEDGFAVTANESGKGSF